MKAQGNLKAGQRTHKKGWVLVVVLAVWLGPAFKEKGDVFYQTPFHCQEQRSLTTESTPLHRVRGRSWRTGHSGVCNPSHVTLWRICEKQEQTSVRELQDGLAALSCSFVERNPTSAVGLQKRLLLSDTQILQKLLITWRDDRWRGSFNTECSISSLHWFDL